jgi:protein tyrosine phosphatase (PTP) superfamily phosphohydrolase (DUF442 family)
VTIPHRRLLLPAVVLATVAGCQSWGKKKCDNCPPPPPPGAPVMAPAPTYGAVPPGGTILPPASPPPGAPAAPPPSFPSGAGYPPVASFYGPSVHLGVPDSVAQAPQDPGPAANSPGKNQGADTPRAPSSSPTIKLLAPEFGSPSAATSPSPNPLPQRGEGTAAATPTLPVGIVDFASAISDRVAAGRKPALDGLDWLKANGFKSVVMLRRPGESDAADRKQIESRGMTFRSIEVSPLTLSAKTVDDFAKLIGDSAAQPLFVYDVDGSLSGGLWYLYFRKVEKLSDEAARLRANRLGLKENADSQREMWLAVQKVLAAKN